MEFLPYYFAAFAISIILVLAFRKPALAIGLVDHPGGRKRHGMPVPLIGGLAMFVTFIMIATFFWPFPVRPYASLFTGMLLLTFVGYLDDRFEITRSGRFFVQVLAALIMTSWGEIQIHSLGNLVGTGPLLLGQWAIPFTVICVVGLVNAVNMTDGFDGLAGGIVMVALLWLSVIAGVAGVNGHSVQLLALLASCIAGFLIFNLRSPWRRKASIFMGDAGSLMLGFALAWFAVYISQAEHGASVPPMAIAWVLAMPIYDTITVIVRRLIRGASPFRPARDHIHHILMRSRVDGSVTTFTLVLVSMVYGGIGVIGWFWGVPQPVMFGLFVLGGLGHLWFSIEGWKHLRRARRAY